MIIEGLENEVAMGWKFNRELEAAAKRDHLKRFATLGKIRHRCAYLLNCPRSPKLTRIGWQQTKKVTINGKDVYQYKNEYYMFTNGGTKSSYFLEYARTLQEAENNLYEDIEAYSVKSFSEEEIIEIVKGDIAKYIVED